MTDYIDQAVTKYTDLAGSSPLKKVPTPFLPDGSLLAEDDAELGELSADACGVLMKNLYAARLSRPDLLKPINDLAKNVTKWTKNCDKQLCRLMSYMSCTRGHTLRGYVADKPEDL
ncbi:unnamed protein product [Polarella glacialis]|uniref:Uncharacterized protein n=1 Tax=Polarella glacialis TaxID=89957 RepID=A0A813L4Y0_POLGL|nr:unnamed protein product [Polarella glacialis]